MQDLKSAGKDSLSDLEDNHDLWMDEIANYQAKTHARMQQVEDWFEASVLVRFLLLFFPLQFRS